MTAAFNDEGVAVVDLRPHIVALEGKMRERTCDIQRGKRLGAFLDAAALRHHGCDQPLENLQLQAERTFGSAGDLGLELSELSGGKTYLSGECLPVNEYAIERRTHQPFAMLRGHLDEIAQHIVVLDL